jgi:hypothetical protein
MSLFMDKTAVTIDELTRHDSNLLEVSRVERVDLTAKLALAHDELEVDLTAIFDRARNNTTPAVSPNYLMLPNVVVTLALRLWDVNQTLVLVYRDAYFDQLNDRYKGKWAEYVVLAKWARDKFLTTDIGLVVDPVPQAGPPVITQIAAADSGGTFYFRVSFVNASGQEGEPSIAVTVTTLDGSVADVQTGPPPANATGWNFYGGFSPETIFLQNPTPLTLGSDFAFYPSAAVTSGPLPGTGQPPDMYRTLPQLLQRG